MNNIDYEKIRKKIEEDSKKRNIYIQGPKGDKGDSGITNIQIGKVEASEKAEVKNVGTNENVILDFKIPKGIGERIIIDKVETIEGQAEVLDDYKENIHHLTFKIPKGEMGPRGLPGEIGISERITIDEVETIEANEEAEILDDYNGNTHHLTFKIPKGEMGPTGPGSGATAFNAILYVGYKEANDPRALIIKEKIFMPSSTTLYEVPTVTNIDIKTTGIYEITLCGKIKGVSQTNGGKVFLLNSVTGTVINNLSFELKEGNTEDLIFSGTTTTEIFAPATLQTRTSISNDLADASITFYDINLTIKRYNV